jgi:methyl-accepting chemotaxis protein
MQYLVKSLQKLKWSVQAKLALAFACMLILFIFNGIISVILINQLRLDQQGQVVVANDLSKLQRFENAFQNEQNVYNQAIFINKIFSVLNDPYQDIILDEISHQEAFAKADLREDSKKLAALYSVAQGDFLQMNSQIQAGNFEAARQTWLNSKTDFGTVQTFLDEWKQRLANTQTTNEQEFNDTFWLAFGLIVVITLASMALAFFFLVLIQKGLLTPLQQLKQGLEEMAQGELDQYLEIVNQDEIGKLAQSFSAALSSIQKIIRGVKISQELEAVAKQLNIVIGLQASGASQQVAAVTQVTATMEELGHTATQIAGSAARVEEVVNVTMTQVKTLEQRGYFNQQQVIQMVQVVEQVRVGIERVENQVLTISQKMADFTEQANSITRVVELLRSLAAEVHLLSLNAAIEAAGAGGETGVRFRSVTNEVRTLAAKARSATVEANSLISQMRQGSQEVVIQVEAGQVEVNNLSSANSGLWQTLQQMQQSTDELAEAAKELLTQAQDVSEEAKAIKIATYQQQLSNAEVVTSIHAVREVTQESAIVSGQITQSSSQLENLTLQLNRVLNQVKLAA